MALVFVGQVLELRAREQSGDAIRALLDLPPKTARRSLPDGTEYDAPLANIRAGDRLRVRPGDAVPVEKGVGYPLTGGTINKTGSLVMTAGRVGADTVLAQIVAVVSNVKRSRAPMRGGRGQDRIGVRAGGFADYRGCLCRVDDLGPGPRALACAVTAAVSVITNALRLRRVKL